jgi:hypothetical protein
MRNQNQPKRCPKRGVCATIRPMLVINRKLWAKT